MTDIAALIAFLEKFPNAYDMDPDALNKRGLLPSLGAVKKAFSATTHRPMSIKAALAYLMSGLVEMHEAEQDEAKRAMLSNIIIMAAVAAHGNHTRMIENEDDQSSFQLAISLTEVIERTNNFVAEPEKATVMLMPAIVMSETAPELKNVHEVALLSAVGLALRHQIYDDESTKKNDTIEALMLIGASLYNKLSPEGLAHFAPHVEQSRAAFNRLESVSEDGHTFGVSNIEVTEYNPEEELRRKLKN